MGLVYTGTADLLLLFPIDQRGSFVCVCTACLHCWLSISGSHHSEYQKLRTINVLSVYGKDIHINIVVHFLLKTSRWYPSSCMLLNFNIIFCLIVLSFCWREHLYLATCATLIDVGKHCLYKGVLLISWIRWLWAIPWVVLHDIWWSIFYLSVGNRHPFSFPFQSSSHSAFVSMWGVEL